MCSWLACAPSPIPPRPSRVGIPRPAVKLPSEPPPTAGLGIPTLDGLGGIGDGAHASHEHILISELPRRAALIAGLIEAV